MSADYRSRRSAAPVALALLIIVFCGVAQSMQAAEMLLPSIGRPRYDARTNGTRSRLVKIPEYDASQVPLLRFKARIDKNDAPGAAYGLRIMLDELPLSQCFLRPRLLNKSGEYTVRDGSGNAYPWFKRIGLGLDHARRENHAWLVPFAGSFEPAETEYVIDLSGAVEPGTTVQLTFHSYIPNRMDHVTPYRADVGKAPLLIDQVEIELTPREKVDTMRTAVTPAPVATIQPGPRRIGANDRAYEIERYGIEETPKGQIYFDDLSGWSLKAFNRDDGLRLDLSGRRQVWSKSTASVTINPEINYLMLLEPPEPILIEETRNLEGKRLKGGRFDAVNVWYGGWYQPVYHRDSYTVQLWVVLEDAAGSMHFMDLGPARTETFGMAMGQLSPIQKRSIAYPVRFRGIAMDTKPSNTRQSIYFDSIAFFEDTRAPLATDEIPSPPNPVPREAGGLLPPVPDGIESSLELAGEVASFTSQTGARRVSYRLTPAQGMLHGIEARLDDGTWFRPMGGGNIMLEQSIAMNGAVPLGEAELITVTERDLTDAEISSVPEAHARAIEATFLYTNQGVTSEYTAAYILEGFSLAIDVRCADGRAMGVDPGRLTGLANPQFVRIPYLTCVNVGMSDREFIFVGPDWHYSDMATIEESTLTPPEPGDEALGLAPRSHYPPLTDGRRLPLRDRWVITLSDQVHDVLPSVPFAPSPRRAELAPYLYRMGGPWQDYSETQHRYGIDRIVATDFYARFHNRQGDVFTGLTEPAKGIDLEQVQTYGEFIRNLGYKPGDSVDLYDMAVLSPRWDPRNAARTPDGRYSPGWTGCYTTKGPALPRISGEFSMRLKELYGLENIYMDTHTIYRVDTADYQADAAGAGMARAAIYGNMQAMRDVAQHCGSVTSEGLFTWIFAGGPDMDYAQVTGYGADPSAYKLTPDFQLMRVHPRTIGLMMGFNPGRWMTGENLKAVMQDAGGRETPEAFYRYVSASLCFGHMAMIGYGYHPPLARQIQLYALMQAPQKAYLPDDVAEIRYHNGQRWLDASDAFRASRRMVPGQWDLYNQIGRVHVRYQGGLQVWANYGENEPWDVEFNGTTYTLPNYGWLIVGPETEAKQLAHEPAAKRGPLGRLWRWLSGQDDRVEAPVAEATPPLLSYSALVDGHRVDYVRSHDYIYVNTGGQPATLDIGTIDGAVWIKKQANNTCRVIPCGDLGKWVTLGTGWKSLDPAGHLTTDRCLNPPADRGVKTLRLNTEVLLGCKPDATTVTGRSFLTDETTPVETKTQDGMLVLQPTADIIDYIAR